MSRMLPEQTSPKVEYPATIVAIYISIRIVKDRLTINPNRFELVFFKLR